MWETKNGLKQTVRYPSRVCLRSRNLIDLCFVKMKFVDATGLININLSDHLATYVVKKKPRENKATENFWGRDYSKFLAEEVANCLHLVTFSDRTDPIDSWGEMEKEFMKVVDDLGPVKEFNISRNRPDYFTGEISNCIRKRDNLFSRARNCKNEAQTKELWHRAVKKRNEMRRLLRKLKRVCHKKIC